jgi:DNA repair protein RadD
MDNNEITRFFTETKVNIWQNPSLREPQIEGYFAIRNHFARSNAPCYVQLPVGCGKTGLMGLTPFGVAQGRVLIIAPNLTQPIALEMIKLARTRLDELEKELSASTRQLTA